MSFSGLNPIYALFSAPQSLTQVNIGGVDNGLCLGPLCNADILNVAKLTSPSESSDGEFSDDLIFPEPTTPTESSDDLILPEPEELSNQRELELSKSVELTNEELSYFRNQAELAVELTNEELSLFRNITEAGLEDDTLYSIIGFKLHNQGKYLFSYSLVRQINNRKHEP